MGDEALLKRLEASWIGAYAAKEEAIARLLSEGGGGWLYLRDMELSEAVAAFSAAPEPESRIGLARAHLEYARTYDALAGLYLDVERTYLESAGGKGGDAGALRLALIALIAKDGERAAKLLGEEAGRGVAWRVAKAAALVLRGDGQAAKEAFDGICRDQGQEPLVAAAAAYWRHPCGTPASGDYGIAATAMAKEDSEAALRALDQIAFGGLAAGASPDLLLYGLEREAHAQLALAAVAGQDDAAAAWIRGEAFSLMGRHDEAAEAFKRAADPRGADQRALWLFGAPIDGADFREISRASMGEELLLAGKRDEGAGSWKTLIQENPGALALAKVAASQAAAGMTEPFTDPLATAVNAVSACQLVRIKAFGMQEGEVTTALLGARHALINRYAAQVRRHAGRHREALDLLQGVHQKRKGYQPDFINPPSFLVELARGYMEAGEYAPAVEILFELNGDFPTARYAYESLKRLYASRSGGEAPPR